MVKVNDTPLTVIIITLLIFTACLAMFIILYAVSLGSSSKNGSANLIQMILGIVGYSCVIILIMLGYYHDKRRHKPREISLDGIVRGDYFLLLVYGFMMIFIGALFIILFQMYLALGFALFFILIGFILSYFGLHRRKQYISYQEMSSSESDSKDR